MASPSYDARALAVHVLGLRRPSDLLIVSEIDETRYDGLVRLRAERVPLQHLLGSTGFRHLDLLVGPGVFVPRPETELVAGAAIDAALAADAARAATDPARAAAPRMCAQFRTTSPPPRECAREFARDPAGPVVVDLCSGSGAIALSVAQEVPEAVVHAVELDPVALDWARRNDAEGRITWHLGPIAGCLTEHEGQVDVVVSNPPYVPLGTRIDPETEQDPQLALWGGVDGLDVIREVEVAARRLLRPGGVVVVEHDVTQGESAPALFEGWADVADHDDLTGRPRYLTARWQP